MTGWTAEPVLLIELPDQHGNAACHTFFQQGEFLLRQLNGEGSALMRWGSPAGLA